MDDTVSFANAADDRRLERAPWRVETANKESATLFCMEQMTARLQSSMAVNAKVKIRSVGDPQGRSALDVRIESPRSPHLQRQVEKLFSAASVLLKTA